MKRVDHPPAPVPRTPAARLRAYRGVNGRHRFNGPSNGNLRLDWNEALVPPSPLVLRRLREFVDTGALNLYADPQATALRRRLAHYTGRSASEILVFNGSDAALDCVARTFTGPGDHVVIAAPCYDNFRVFAEATGALADQVLGADPFAPNVDGLLASIRPETRLVYLCNPNNPTGAVYGLGQIERLLRKLVNGVLLVDEAYFEFSGATSASLLDRYGHLVITRSFSKAFALAGVRCGYALAGRKVAGYVSRIRNGKDVNALAQVAACAALDDLDYMRRHVDRVRRSRTWLVKALEARGREVVASGANFVLLACDAPARLVKSLRAKGIFVRDRSDLPQLDRWVRVTVGASDECRRLVAALDELESRVPPRAASRPAAPRGLSRA